MPVPRGGLRHSAVEHVTDYTLCSLKHYVKGKNNSYHSAIVTKLCVVGNSQIVFVGNAQILKFW